MCRRLPTLVLCSWAPLWGCADPGGEGGGADSGTGGAGPDIVDVQLERSEVVPTVATVRWTTREPSTGAVQFWEQGGDGVRSVASAMASTSHEVVLVGLPEVVDAQARVEATDATGTSRSEVLDFETGALAAAVPRPVLDGDAEGSLGGYTLAPVSALSVVPTRYLTVVDPAGRLVWAWGGEGLETQRGRLTHDGQGVVIMDAEMEGAGMDLVRVDWDGSERWRLPVPRGHHDFDLVDDETFVVLRSDVREAELAGQVVSLAGDAVVELGLDGQERELWNTWDHYTPSETDRIGAPAEGDDVREWSHGNFVELHPDTGQLDFTLRNLSVAGSVEAATGAQRWLLRGGPGTGVPLENPHSAWPTDEGLLVFDQADYEAGGCSRVKRLVGDLPAGQAEEVWSYDGEACFSVFYLGNAQVLAEGRMLVGWGSSGVVDEADLWTGAREWRLRWPAETWVLYVERVDTLGPPAP